MYYDIRFFTDSDNTQVVYSYMDIGSKDQMLEGARIKSFQRLELRNVVCQVVISKNGEFICSRTFENGNIL